MNFHSRSSSGIDRSDATSYAMAASRRQPVRRAPRAQALVDIDGWGTSGLMRAVDANLTLCQRDGDAMLLEQRPDGAIDLRAHVVHALLWIGDPEAQLELDAMIAELHETRHRGRIAQHPPLALAGAQQY